MQVQAKPGRSFLYQVMISTNHSELHIQLINYFYDNTSFLIDLGALSTGNIFKRICHVYTKKYLLNNNKQLITWNLKIKIDWICCSPHNYLGQFVLRYTSNSLLTYFPLKSIVMLVTQSPQFSGKKIQKWMEIMHLKRHVPTHFMAVF